MLWRTIAQLGLAAILIGLGVVGVQHWRNSGGGLAPPRAATALRIATYNVHYIILGQETGPWSRGDWLRRRGPLDLAFKAVDADVMTFQEMESFAHGSGGATNLALDWLLQRNPDYAAAATGDPAAFPSTQPIFYRTARLALVDQGWFFFSTTPEVIYSRTFDGSFPAYASWAMFRDRQSGVSFRVVNLHTDYASRSNRLASVALVADRIAPWIAAEETVFLAGDLNARQGDPVVVALEAAGLAFVDVAGSTYHFNRGLNLFGAIDHLAYAGDARPLGDPFVLRTRFAGEWPTDHYPVAVDVTLGP